MLHAYYQPEHFAPGQTLEQVEILGRIENMRSQNNEELATVGSPLYVGARFNNAQRGFYGVDDPITENDLRAEMGDPIIRLTYGSQYSD